VTLPVAALALAEVPAWDPPVGVRELEELAAAMRPVPRDLRPTTGGEGTSADISPSEEESAVAASLDRFAEG
jgi:hypothetical protein